MSRARDRGRLPVGVSQRGQGEGVGHARSRSRLAPHVRRGVGVPVSDRERDVRRRAIGSGEHVRKTWVWIKETARVCETSGTVITIDPVSWPHYEAPMDCWRAFPEGMKAPYAEAELEVLGSVWESLELGGFGITRRGTPPEACGRLRPLGICVLGRRLGLSGGARLRHRHDRTQAPALHRAILFERPLDAIGHGSELVALANRARSGSSDPREELRIARVLDDAVSARPSSPRTRRSARGRMRPVRDRAITPCCSS